METHNYWGENGHNTVKYDNYNSNDGFGRAVGEQLNFAAPSEDEAEYPPGTFLKKGKQDPMSHRIIEKRRRDRMNNCLADLSRLIPPEYLKKGRGRVEKTEIIEMAIRHIKFLQERANAAETVGAGSFRAGFQDAVQETARFLVDLHGFNAADSLCVQLAAHLQRHLEGIAKGEGSPPEGARLTGSSSETTSSSGSSHGLAMKGVIQTTIPAHQPTQYHDHYEPPDTYEMECDRVSMPVPIDGEVLPASEPLPLDGRKHNSPTLRSVRKPENDDYLHSYKFKNSIERRFSRSQDNIDAPDMRATNVKVYPHKRRRAARPALPPPCTSTSTSNSGSGSTEEARDTSPQDTSSESPHHHQYEKHPPPSDFVPVFALNALGKYYVPLNVEHACLSRLGSGVYDALGSRAVQLSAPLHPVTIHVNFQPCLDYHCVKRESNDNHLRQ